MLRQQCPVGANGHRDVESVATRQLGVVVDVDLADVVAAIAQSSFHRVAERAAGSWQQLSPRAETLLALTRPDDVPDLWSRLGAMLSPQQRLVTLDATLPAPWCWFEHAAMVLGLLVGVLERAPVDLSAWPGRDGDRPLYELGS